MRSNQWSFKVEGGVLMGKNNSLVNFKESLEETYRVVKKPKSDRGPARVLLASAGKHFHI